MRTGRPVKCYVASYDRQIKIAGLSRQPDGRWRVLLPAGGEKRFAEADEMKAIERAKQLLGLNQIGTTDVTVELGELVPGLPRTIEEMTPAQLSKVGEVFADMGENSTVGDEGEGSEVPSAPMTVRIPDVILWPWLRNLLLTQPELVARKTGIKAVSGLRDLDIPRDTIKISQLIEHYKAHNKSEKQTKAAAIRAMEALAKHARAKTLGDLTKEKLHGYCQTIETSKTINSAGTKKHHYGQLRGMLSFGLKSPIFDAAEIRHCLDRAKVLWTSDAENSVDPRPISREDFHALLAAATVQWRAWLLLGLNACMYIGEIRALTWRDLDLDGGTLAMIRTKTKRKRIPRAAILWPETIEAIKALPAGPEYVFTSSHGTKYRSSNSLANMFATLRTRAGISDEVSFSHLRDGAFTATSHGTKDDRLAKILAGHSAGMADQYVLRNPEIVRPACDAVYAKYGPFQKS